VFPFAVTWASLQDGGESTVVRAEGPNATDLSGTIDNTTLYRVMRKTLLGISE
jgi:alkaline phosphatase